MLKIKQLSSLAKVFKNKIYGKATKSLQTLKGQSVSFQIAYSGEGEYTYKIKSELKKYISVYEVGYVPAGMPAYVSCDDGKYENRKPGLFPDPLFPKSRGKIKAGKQYSALWVTVDIPKDIKAGTYAVDFIFKGETESLKITEKIEIADIELIPHEIVFTQWFHTDCIANYHRVGVYSEAHWKLIYKYMKMACDHGINMILVPVLTPPLDTGVGLERTTTQLVKITLENGKYTFDFSKLHRYINIAKECGMKYFEINHMFTQWGATSAPKVIATVDGVEKRIFGWETKSTSPEYTEFLRALIPALIKELEALGLSKEQVCFHASDEPNEKNLENYKKVSGIIKPLIKGYKLTDALSHLEFYKQGLVDVAVCGTSDIEPFIKENLPNLWGYYCCVQNIDVSNRFFSMSSSRNRIIGTQIYKYGLKGFLHWGYNFYNTQYSKKKINPYKITDAGGAFPSGDSFSVYPYKGGVIPSLRLKVFKEGLDDVSLLYMLEDKIGREEAIALLERVAGEEITFKAYPNNEEFFARLKKAIIKELK